MPLVRTSQLRYLSIVLLAWLSVFFLTRSVLLVSHLPEAEVGLWDLARLYSVGLVYDLGFLLYAGAPLAVYLLLCPNGLWRRSWHKYALHALVVGSLFVMLFTAVAEWFFWDEFGVRFNFIAVDYLVYSTEVINNILESYPIFPILTGLALLAVGIGFALRKPLRAALASPPLPKRHALGVLAGLALMLGISGVLLGQDFPRGLGGNAYQRELASNGPFQFFAAFRNNELDYPQFYATLPDDQIAGLLRDEIAEPNAHFVGSDPEDVRRLIDNPGQPKRLNVVLVTIESLSAKYLGSFGDSRGLTPNLDELRKHSLAFSNFYATGTRTDRGLEAITLSIPPTPGRSIVKRIGRESGFASLGQQFNAEGYDSVFIYGGRGYFDNMNAFFGGNGYRIVDQSSVPSAEMTFQNAWGMSDEDIYRQTLKVADADHAAGKPFFLQLMTTSNHRPYTYPDGRIDIPSGDGRAGAVKYTDYAIGQFLAEARQKPWFAQTVFVFVADHTAGSAGKEDLPVANYHIPLFIYAPAVIQPREITAVASQIDLAPTLLGLLNFDYTSSFFGRNVLGENALPGRALISNYQHLGLFDGDSLAILSTRRAMRRHDDARGNSREVAADRNDALVRRTIAYYQGASHDFRHGLLAWRPPAAKEIRLSDGRPVLTGHRSADKASGS
jgi:phosphoglycerol transferase MdoB-like AlkP superfamily enzyme